MRKEILWIPMAALIATSLAACDLSPGQLQQLALSAAQTTEGKALINDVSADVQSANDLSQGQSMLTSSAAFSAAALTSAAPLTTYAVETLSADASATASFKMRDAIEAFKQHKRFEQFAQFKKQMLLARTRLQAMRAAFKKRAAARMAKWQQGLSVSTSSATASAADGTPLLIDSATMSINRPNYKQTQVLTKTYAVNTDQQNDLIEAQGLLTRTFGKASFVAYRDRVNNSDGTFTVTYSATTSFTPSSGSVKVKTVNWNEAGNADGSATFTGTLVRFNGTTVQLSMTKDTSGNETTQAVDSSAKVEADVSQSDSSTAATGTIGEPGKTTLKGAVSDNVSDTESVDLSNGQ